MLKKETGLSILPDRFLLSVNRKFYNSTYLTKENFDFVSSPVAG